MQVRSVGSSSQAPFGGVGAPHVLLAAEDIAVRLTLAAVLERCGFLVETANTAQDAESKIEQGVYDMVLCDLKSQPMEVRRRVLETARAQSYGPATALIEVNPDGGQDPDSEEALIEPVDIPQLMTQITDLMANRAYGRSLRGMREPAA
jgi:CheY-like chemotaxis protein